MFGDLSAGLQARSQFSFLSMQSGTVRRSALPQLVEELKSVPSVHLVVGEDENQITLLLITMKRDDGLVNKLLVKHGWTDVELAQESLGGKEEVLADLDGKLAGFRAEQDKPQVRRRGADPGKASRAGAHVDQPAPQRAVRPHPVLLQPHDPHPDLLRLAARPHARPAGRGAAAGDRGQVLPGVARPQRDDQRPEGQGPRAADRPAPAGPLQDAGHQLLHPPVRDRGPHPLRVRGLPGHVRADVRRRGPRPDAGPGGHPGYGQATRAQARTSAIS